MQYRLQDDVYSLVDGDRVVHRGKEVAIAFSFDGTHAVMHKHGNPQLVEHWLKGAQDSIRKTSFPEFADEFRMITSDQWSVDDLNKIIDNTLYFHQFMSDNDLLAGNFVGLIAESA